MNMARHYMSYSSYAWLADYYPQMTQLSAASVRHNVQKAASATWRFSELQIV